MAKKTVQIQEFKRLAKGRVVSVKCGCMYCDVQISRFINNCLGKAQPLWFEVEATNAYLFVENVLEHPLLLKRNDLHKFD